MVFKVVHVLRVSLHKTEAQISNETHNAYGLATTHAQLDFCYKAKISRTPA